jgi:hypothetical protein
MTMPQESEVKKDARRIAQLKKLGPDARCAHCGESQWEALVPPRRTLLEQHHVAGKINNKTLTLPLCKNCHAKEHERLRQVGVDMRGAPTRLACLVAQLRAVGGFLVKLGEHWLSEADALETSFAPKADNNQSKPSKRETK